MAVSKRIMFGVLVMAFCTIFVGCDSENTACEKSCEPQKACANQKEAVNEKVESAPETISQASPKDDAAQKVSEEVVASKVLVDMKTSMGNIVLELDREKAPVTVANFLGYVEDGFFESTIFHRVINTFMIQGGGFTADMTKKSTKAPIVNEANNGLGNLRGTIAMARTNNPNSATCQFFINHKDNAFLNYSTRNPGYAVFGKVVEGMDVVDKIASSKTARFAGMADVPVETITIETVTVK